MACNCKQETIQPAVNNVPAILQNKLGRCRFCMRLAVAGLAASSVALVLLRYLAPSAQTLLFLAALVVLAFAAVSLVHLVFYIARKTWP